MSKLEEIEQQRIYTLIDRIARDVGVKRSQVTDVGPALKTDRWTIICVDCRQREMNADMYLEPLDELPQKSVYTAFAVDLLHKYNSANGTTGGVYAVLVGQCPDCGQVYFAQATVREVW